MTQDSSQMIERLEKRIAALHVSIEKVDLAIQDRLDNPYLEKRVENDVSKRHLKYIKLSELEASRTRYALELEKLEEKLAVLKGTGRKRSKVKTVYIQG